MAEHQEPYLDGDGPSSSTSSFQKTVVLRDWWLIKCSNEFEGKRFGVAGTESFETRTKRAFKSSPIIKALDVFTLQTSDGILITLRGFLNKERVIENGFNPEIVREFIFGFPPCWERICNNHFEEVPSIIDKAPSPILSPCKYSKWNLEDNTAESRDKTSVTEVNTAETNKKDGSKARDKITARRKSLHLQSKSGGENVKYDRTLKSSRVKNTTNDGYELDECKATYNEDNERKLSEREIKSRPYDGDCGNEILDKAKSRDVEIYEGDAMDDEVTLPVDGCGRKHGEDKVSRVTTTSAAGESLTSEQRTGELQRLRSAGNKRKLSASKVKNPTTNDCEGLNKRHPGTYSVGKLNSENATKKSLTSEEKKGQLKVPKAYLHSLSKDVNSNSKFEKKGKSKKSVKNLKSDCNVVEPMNHSGSEANKVEEPLSWEKTKRKIDFDVEVTLDKEAKKQETNAASPNSLGQKRSRSGRVLVSSLEFWRNQVPVYDMDRNLIEVKEGCEANSIPSSKGNVSESRKPRK